MTTKKLENPFADFWYGKQQEEMLSSTPKPEVIDADTEEDQYHVLKRAIQQEAIRKWKQVK